MAKTVTLQIPEGLYAALVERAASEGMTVEAFLDDPPAAMRLMLVEPAAEGGESIAALQREPTPPDAAVLVGPEGGWAEQEREAARERHVRLVTLGPRTLRADAVPVAAISVLQFLWNDL